MTDSAAATQAYAQPRLFEDAKFGAGDTAAVQGDMLLPANDRVEGRDAALSRRVPLERRVRQLFTENDNGKM